jgi:hypothetical protein
LLNLPGDDAARLRIAYLRAYSRPPSAAETLRAAQFVDAYRKQLVAEGVADEDATARAWQALCRVILSSNEFVYLE